MVRFAANSHVSDQLRQTKNLADQRCLLLGVQQLQVVRRGGDSGFAGRPQDTGATRMRILNVGDRILARVGRRSRLEVEVHLGIGRALQHEEPRRVRPDLLDQLTQRDDLAGPLRHPHALVAATQVHQLVEQDLKRVAVTADGGNRRLRPCHVALMISAPNVDHRVEPTIEKLVVVIGDI